MTYQTLTKPISARLDIKKSEFLSYAYPVVSRDKAMFHVEQLRLKFPDARHCCWAYIIGDPNNTTSAGFDDDGEPSGTAGKPILNVLQHKTIGNVIIIVVRYFGGIKLGAGGLTRAYAGAAQAIVDVAKAHNSLSPYIEMIQVRIETDFSNESQVRYIVEDMGGDIEDVNYAKAVTLTLQLPKADIMTLTDRLSINGRLILDDDPVIDE